MQMEDYPHTKAACRLSTSCRHCEECGIGPQDTLILNARALEAGQACIARCPSCHERATA